MKTSGIFEKIILCSVVALFGASAIPRVSFAAETNLVANPSLETAENGLPSGWSSGSWGDLSASFSYPVIGYDGGRAASVAVSGWKSGDAKWYFDEVPATPGTEYVFSDKSLSDVATDVVAQFSTGDGSYRYEWFGSVPGTGEWEPFEVAFTVPGGAVAVTVFHVIATDGILSVDRYSLAEKEPDPVPEPSDNLIPNPSFETANGNLPVGWARNHWGDLSASFSYPVTGYDGGRAASVSVSGWKSGDAKWYFDEVPVTPGTEYVFSDRSRSDVATDVVAQFRHDDQTYSYSSLGSVSGTGEWKEFDGSFTVPSGVVALSVLHVIASVGTLSVDGYSLTEAVPEPGFPEPMITFSFDDGFRSVYEYAIPILDEAGIRSTQAVVTGFFGEPDYMTEAQVAAMVVSGHEVASHSRTHADLTKLSDAEAETEVLGSKSDLAALGIPVITFVYPFGAYDDRTIGILKSAGYLGARGVQDGLDSPDTDPYRLRDRHITSDVSFEDMKGWIDEAVAERKWLVLELHRQDPNGDEFSNDPELLGRVVSYVRDLDVRTVTLGEGIAMLGD